MTRFILLFVILFVTVAVAITGCSSGFVPRGGTAPSGGSSAPASGLVQSNTGGNVTIDMTWIKTETGPLSFNVAMNTHSVDLDQYDLGKLATLRDDAGNTYTPLSWEAAAGGHHRSGKLTFPVPDSLSQKKTKYIEIVIRDVAGIEQRILKWAL
ncbi:MAG: hypothetical protein HY529_00130 [Chloroflexi bacterium]|nr:hypothetical protein [Chloroflexota bacterium]